MMIYRKKTICVAVILVAAVTTGAWAEDPYQVAWKTQIGTDAYDCSFSVAVDVSGNVYISGYTDGDLGGPNAGYSDAFLSKFDSGGNEVWTTQIGTSAYDLSRSVALDASGNAYIGGQTSGDLGGSSAGDIDAFVSKFDSNGNEVWTTQIGTSGPDPGFSVAADASGNTYITGETYSDFGGPYAGNSDVFLSKFDSSGDELWTTQIGTSSYDRSQSVAVDASGNAYITGYTEGDLGGPNAGGFDGYLSKFDSAGNEVWSTQIGTGSNDYSHSVAVDASGNAHVVGSSTGDFGGPDPGGRDVFVRKLDSDGNEIWTTQIGTENSDNAYAVAVDASGNVYISGFTRGDFGGRNAGYNDAFLSKLDSGGSELWTTQIGTGERDYSYSVALDAFGNAYISGTTEGDLGGPNVGDWDAFVVKYEVPEPATLGMLALGSLTVLRRRSPGRRRLLRRRRKR